MAMRIVPAKIEVLNDQTPAVTGDSPIIRSGRAARRASSNAPRYQNRRSSTQQAFKLETILAENRIIIIEGISGSGKDTFQKYLRTKLEGRDIYEYSEGDVLLSWNQLQVRDIFKLQVRFMKNFVNFAKDIITQHDNSVFLLNRFHLSTYAMAIVKQPELQREYDQVIRVLRSMPVHVFILQLIDSEIETRTLHPERAGAWQQFQRRIVEKQGFNNRVERYILQQKLMLEAAVRQQIAFSTLRLPSGPELRANWAPLADTTKPIGVDGRTISTNVKYSNGKRRYSETIQEDN